LPLSGLIIKADAWMLRGIESGEANMGLKDWNLGETPAARRTL